MGKFEAKVDQQGEKVKLFLSGVIDEDADFSQLKIGASKEVVLDLTSVKSINSCGIREWIKWVGTMDSKPISYQNCPKVIVDQINMVDGFLPRNAKVDSFFVPYYNEESGAEKNVLFRNGTEFNGGIVTPPTQVQDDDGNAMEMDIIESKYFKFLTKTDRSPA